MHTQNLQPRRVPHASGRHLEHEGDEETGDVWHVRVQVRQHRTATPLPPVCNTHTCQVCHLPEAGVARWKRSC